MSKNNNGIRYTRPVTNDYPQPRFNAPQNRNLPRNNLNDTRVQPPKPNNNNNNNQQQQQQQNINNKTSTETNISTTSTSPANVNHPSNQNMTTKPEQNIISSGTPNPTENKSDNSINVKSTEEQRQNTSGGQKRAYPIEQSSNETMHKSTQGGRSRLFIGNVPSDLTKDEFLQLFGKFGELVEYYVNPSRGFGFVKLASKHLAEQAKYELDGFTLRGKPLRIRFASQGAIVKVKNLSPNVSNELLKQAFEQHFGVVERAVIIVDDRGKSTGEGIVEFEKKPSAQKCLSECTESCFFVTSELKPVIVEPWDIKDEDDGLPEKSLNRNDAYYKERNLKPRFAEPNTIDYAIGLKWKQLEAQEKQLLDEVKRRMQYASEQLQIEIDEMLLEHQTQMLRDELMRRQEDLRRIDELRSYDMDRRRDIMQMHPSDAYNSSIGNMYQQNQGASAPYQYNNVQTGPYQNPTPLFPQQSSNDATYTTNHTSRGYNMQLGSHPRSYGNDYNPQQQQQQQQFPPQYQQQGFDRKRPRH